MLFASEITATEANGLKITNTKKPQKNEVTRNHDSQVSVHICKQHLTILL